MSPRHRAFRFGVEMKAPFEGRTWADSARQLEALGYSTLFVPDHFHSGFGPITAMATALAATTTLKVAPLVMAVDFRHPAVLAKEIATLDALFPGRVEVGLGAGYNPLDYSRSGIRMDPPGRRVARLIEYVEVLRGLFAGAPFTFRGAEYQLDDITGTPLPATPGGPPILVAGGGPRLLRGAARSADIVGINPSTALGRDHPGTIRDALEPAIDVKVDLVRDAAGDRWESIELNAWVSLAGLTSSDPTVLDAVAQLSAWAGIGPDELLSSPIVLVGSPEEVVDRLERRRQRWGYSYTCLTQEHAHDFTPIVTALTGR